MTDDAPPPPPPDEAPAPLPPAGDGLGKGPGATDGTSAAEGSAEPGPYRTAAPRTPPPPPYRASYAFLAVVSIVSLGLDLGTKQWAVSRLEIPPCMSQKAIQVVQGHLSFSFACNMGGAWGLLQNEPESIRRPFFIGISFLAIAFIVSLYRKLTPPQWALRWGLPLVLGGALGNLVNRVQFNHVVDFIVYRAEWVRALNRSLFHSETDAWPTFNIADVAIVAGVILMAIDMFTPRKTAKVEAPPAASASVTAEPAAAPPAASEPAAPVPPPAADAPAPKES
jgi:signal peptidase II